MLRGSIARIMMIIMSVLMLTGTSLATWMLVTEDDRSDIEINLSDEKTETIRFENLSLVPGESCEYIVALKGDKATQYDLTLDFVDTCEEMTLKNFARVKIMFGEDVVCDELLAEIFDNDDLVLNINLSVEKNTELKLVYYLPIEVGNEAKNAEAVFELLLTASNE